MKFGGRVGAATTVMVLALVVAANVGAGSESSERLNRSTASSKVYLVPFLGSFRMSCTWGGSNPKRCRLNGSNYHPVYALDIQLPNGTDVRAAGKGVVRQAASDSSYGNYVLIWHSSSGRTSMYAHLRRINVTRGQSVVAGQKIGESGKTGNATGYHLHYAEAAADTSTPIWSSGDVDPGTMTGSCDYPTCWGISSWTTANIDPALATNPYVMSRGRKASVPGDWEGYIVQWDGDTKSQKTAWLVRNYKRYWIPSSSIYNCLKGKGVPGPQTLPSGTLDELTDQNGVWATC